MNPERLTHEDIKALALSEGPAITLVLPTNTNGDQRIHLKSHIEKLKEQARENGLDVHHMLERITLPPGNHAGPIAYLVSPSESMMFRVSAKVPPMAKLGRRFDLRTLLAIADCQKTFHMVALSLNRARILECTENSSTEIPFPAGFPSSLDEFLQTKKPDHVLDNRHTGGPSTGSMKGVMFGTSTDREKHEENRHHYFISLDRAVNTALKGHTAPLIPVGVETELALYQKINTYPHLVTPGISGSADGLDGRELHTRALDLLDNDPNDPKRKLLADFDKKVGTGHASFRIPDIITAAHEGRVSHLFFQEGAHYEGSFDPSRQRIKHHTDSLDDTVDLVDDAAQATLQCGGEVFLLSPRLMPNGVPVCALYRYPAPESAEVAKSARDTISVSGA